VKKKELAMWIEAANHGHRLLLTHYWVNGVYLVRITDATGKRYRGGYAVIEDDNDNLDRDRARLNWLIALRNKVEKLQHDLQNEPPEPIDESDLDLDDLDLPDGTDLRLPGESDLDQQDDEEGL
jgi:hypothetical protein